ncbi:Pkinase-domain-containing protein [Trichodelitschia bisporula]|uniref:Pkinase-domain-containing protein n=1 Tax=Trichodelitschia bisporula TaxID=703511 RepID=A0A6G1I929_9PEZI|nr:Pkinase-domain-containing protein [Trichodelitschia bisporula]
MSQASPPKSTPTAPVPLNRSYSGCSSIRNYEIGLKLGEGTFGEVYKATSIRTGAVVALKKILMHHEKDGFPITALREIKLLKMLSHVNVIKLEEMAVERPRGSDSVPPRTFTDHKEPRKRGILYMVTPYMEHDLSGLLENKDVHLKLEYIKCYMLQLLRGIKYLHNSHILHRDMKAANILISNRGILKIADFGLARHYDEPVPRPGAGGGEAKRDYTMLVVTRWYRPPELLLSLRRYTTAIDMWGIGCILGEMFNRKPIFTGNSELHQAQLIFDLVGSPNEESMPGWSSLPGCEGVKTFEPRKGKLEASFEQYGKDTVSLLGELLKLDWRKRINAIDALEHPFFKNHPLPSRPDEIPWYSDSHELDRRSSRSTKQALPPAPAGGSVGIGANGEWTGTGSVPLPHHPLPQPPPSSRPPGWKDTPAPQLPPFNNRVPPAALEGNAPPPRRTPWQQGPPPPYQYENLPPPPRHAHLPPPPPNGARHPLPHNPMISREPREPPRFKDTYVPSYTTPDAARRHDRVSREPDERRSREPPGREPPGRFSHPPPWERDDRRPPPPRGEYRDRDREERLGPDRNWGHRRTRSRSPQRDRPHDRDRDFYRR